MKHGIILAGAAALAFTAPVFAQPGKGGGGGNGKGGGGGAPAQAQGNPGGGGGGGKQARGGGDRRVLRVAPGGKRIGLRIVDEIDPRHGKARTLAEIAHHMHQLGGGALVNLHRVMGGERQPVRVPIGEEVGRKA